MLGCCRRRWREKQIPGGMTERKATALTHVEACPKVNEGKNSEYKKVLHSLRARVRAATVVEAGLYDSLTVVARLRGGFG